MSVVVGDHVRNAGSSVRQTLDVVSLKLHENYNSRTSANDVALIKTATDIAFSAEVAPVCAPETGNDYVYYKSQCSGWGSLVSGERKLRDQLISRSEKLCKNARLVLAVDVSTDVYPVATVI